MPTWLTAWLPPPASTNAVRGSRTRRRRSWLIGSGHRLFSLPFPRASCSRSRGGSGGPHQPRTGLSGAEKAELCCARNQPPTPTPHSSEGAGGPRVSEFYRNYLAVAVFIGAALLMVGAMLGVGTSAPPDHGPDPRSYMTYEAGSDPVARLRPVERPLLRVRPALRDVRRRGRVHLPVGRPPREPRRLRPRSR